MSLYDPTTRRERSSLGFLASQYIPKRRKKNPPEGDSHIRSQRRVLADLKVADGGWRWSSAREIMKQLDSEVYHPLFFGLRRSRTFSL